MEFLSIRLPASPPLLHFQFSSFATNSDLNLIRTAPPSRCTIPIYAPVVVSRRLSSSFVCCSSNCTGKIGRPFCSPSPLLPDATVHVVALLFRLVACGVLFAGFRAPAFAVCLTSVLPTIAAVESDIPSTDSLGSAADGVEDEELRAAFEQWKSKIFALTVPLRIIALQGSMPPFWIKEFVQTQGKRLKMNIVLRNSLESIYSELNLALDKGFLDPKSAMAADLVSLGDSWLGNAIQRGLIEYIPNIEEQDWFMSLGNKWKVHLCRNMKGELDPSGNIWGVPYRWGTMVIAYKKCKFSKHNFAPIKDWDDLWRPELAGKISMIDSPREVVGAVLKRMGASYNTKDIDLQVTGGRKGVLDNLKSLQRQVRLFDSMHYLKSFGAGDVWVAVGWSSDVIPQAKRMSNVAVVVPNSGTSIWADLWSIPAATKFNTNRIGGRTRGPSPLVHQWMEFCLQSARALPFQQEVIPGASPLALQQNPVEGPLQPTQGEPKLDSNLVYGIPPPEILEKCEFLEPLSEQAMEDYKWLISSMEKPHGGRLSPIVNIFLRQKPHGG